MCMVLAFGSIGVGIGLSAFTLFQSDLIPSDAGSGLGSGQEIGSDTGTGSGLEVASDSGAGSDIVSGIVGTGSLTAAPFLAFFFFFFAGVDGVMGVAGVAGVGGKGDLSLEESAT
jgi:hypothetical protein